LSSKAQFSSSVFLFFCFSLLLFVSLSLSRMGTHQGVPSYSPPPHLFDAGHCQIQVRDPQKLAEEMKVSVKSVTKGEIVRAE
jgi:hypothetical protein